MRGRVMLRSTRRVLELIQAAGKAGIARRALKDAMGCELEEDALGFRLGYLRQQGYIRHVGPAANGRWVAADDPDEMRAQMEAEQVQRRKERRAWPPAVAPATAAKARAPIQQAPVWQHTPNSVWALASVPLP